MGEFFLGIVWQIVFPILLMGWFATCFVIFDAFHISSTPAHLGFAVAPFIVLAVWLVRTGKIKR